MFETHEFAELLPEREALGGGKWCDFGDVHQDVDIDQDVDVDVDIDGDDNDGDVDVTAFNNANVDQSSK
jgi:hypothetical protein